MNILIVDRSMRVVDRMQNDYDIDPRRDHVVRASRPEHIMGLDLTGWLVVTARCHFVCSYYSARTARENLIEELE